MVANTQAKIKQDDGYTLIELMVVLMIVGLGYALVSSSIVGGGEGIAFNTALERTIADMKRLRGKAILNGTVEIFEISQAGQGYKLSMQSEAVVFEGGIMLVDRATGQNTGLIYFYPDGTNTDFKMELVSENVRKFITSIWPIGGIGVGDEG